jgi:hypothetical protein
MTGEPWLFESEVDRTPARVPDGQETVGLLVRCQHCAYENVFPKLDVSAFLPGRIVAWMASPLGVRTLTSYAVGMLLGAGAASAVCS